MDRQTILDRISESDDLLSLPQALAEVLREVDKPEASADGIAKIIMKDPGMTARLLRLANSPFYQRFAPSRSIGQAVQVLGLMTVKCLALSSAIFRQEAIERVGALDTRQFFTDILTVATGAEIIARRVGLRSPDEAFVAGLLHQVGIIYLLSDYPDDYGRVVRGEVEATSLLGAEESVFGISHATIGYQLAQRWRLPDGLAIAIRDYRSLNDIRPDDTLTNVLALASALTTESIDNYVVDMESRAKRIHQLTANLQIDESDIGDLLNEMISKTLDTAEYLEVDIGSMEEMLGRANQRLWRSFLMIENLFKDRQEMSKKLLQQERLRGALETKNIAMATLSHYLNNAIMAIYGRSQLIRARIARGNTEAVLADMEKTVDVIDGATKRIVAVISEMREITPLDHDKFLNASLAMNMDDRIERRVTKMDTESGLVLPHELDEMPTPQA